MDLWYALEMSGQRVGHAHITVQREGDRIVTRNTMKMTIKRGPLTLPIQQESRFVETPDGKPVEVQSETKSSMTGTFQRIEFTDDGPVLISGQGQRSRRQKLKPFEDGWLTPYQADQYIREQLEAGSEQFEIRTLDLSMGTRPVSIQFKRVGEEDAEVFGKVVPAVAFDATLATMPGSPMRQLVNQRGELVKQTMSLMPGLDITLMLADRDTATAEVDPPEIMAQTLIKPSTPIAHPRTLRRATYKITKTDGGELTLPRGGAQRVVYGPGNAAIVVIDLDQPVNPEDDTPTDADSAASTMLNFKDPRVADLAKQALAKLGGGSEAGGDASDMDKAEAMRAFVHDYLTEKNLSVGLATASEVARTRQGDCTEHAALLAALLRAADIPSRTASGLLYVDQFIGQRGVFGYHMWAQAWIDGRWVDFDAILPDHRFDATHILLSTSAMSDAGYQNDMVQLLPLLGTLKIEVQQAGDGSADAGASKTGAGEDETPARSTAA